jgi:cytochrome c-type biogenesis protein CcmH/NrfF
MLRFRSKWLLGLVAGMCLAQTASDYVSADIRRVGDHLACLCGSCNNTVGTCQMIGCHYSSPARLKIKEMQAQGANDQQILDAFVKQEGSLKALAVPPMSGFNILAWVTPFFAIGLGLFAITVWVKRFRKPAPVQKIDQVSLDRYNAQIEKDLAKLDE